jgi:hypothetical protein
LGIGKGMLEPERAHNELQLLARETTADLVKANEELLESTERRRVEAALRESEQR